MNELEPGLRVRITGGPYEGRSGETVREYDGDRWYVRLDDHAKMALVDVGHVEVVTN